MLHELSSLVQAGLTPQQALAAATSAPARAFRLADRGRIAKGYKADLLLVQGDAGSDVGARAPYRRSVEGRRRRQPAAQGAAGQGGGRAGAAHAAAAGAAGRWPHQPILSRQAGQPDRHRLGDRRSTNSSAASPASSSRCRTPAPTASVRWRSTPRWRPGFAYPWAGLAFMPGAQMMQPADLRGAKVLRFRVKGDGQPLQRRHPVERRDDPGQPAVRQASERVERGGAAVRWLQRHRLRRRDHDSVQRWTETGRLPASRSPMCGW